MKSMILTGAGGFVGSELLRTMCNRYRIVALARTRKESLPQYPGVLYRFGDLLELAADNVLDALPDRRADLFVHAAGQAHISQTGDAGAWFARNNVTATEAALRLAVQAKVGKFILISSAVVYNENPNDLYERSKREAEERVVRICRLSGISCVIVRPVMVYGENEPGGYTAGMIGRIFKGWVLLPHSGRKLKPMIYVKNLSYLVCKAAEFDTGERAILLARDREAWTPRKLYGFVSGRLGRSCRFVPVPTLAVKAAIIAVHLLQTAGLLRRMQVRSLRHLNRDVRYPLDERNEALIAGLPYTAEEGWSATVSSHTDVAFSQAKDGVFHSDEHDHQNSERRFDKSEPERSLPN